MDRTLSSTVEEAERRRVNPDRDTQSNLKVASKGVTHAPIYQAEHVRHLVEPLHNGLSFGRALTDLLVRFNGDIFSTTIEADVKPLYDATKSTLKNSFLEVFGFNPFDNLIGTQVAVMLKVDHHEKLMSLVPEIHKEIFQHWVNETRFYLGFIFHLDPHATFDLAQVKTRFEAMLIFFAEEMAWWVPPDYFHIGSSHVIQILEQKNPAGKFKYKNLTQTGAQDKENKNQKQRLFFKQMARKNDNQNAIIDVLIRDMEESSVEMREHGSTKPVHQCGDCGGLGHHKKSKRCPKMMTKGKFIDMTLLDDKYHNKSDSDTDRSLDSDVSDVSHLEGSDVSEDMEISVDERVDDCELEEAFADVESPDKNDKYPDVRRKLL